MTVQYKDVKDFVYKTLQDRLNLLGVSEEEFTDSFQLLPGVIDSLGFLELVAQVEQEFQVEMDFEDADPQTYTTLEGFIRCIKGM